MSEESNTETSVLLPAASIAVFTRETDTAESAQAIERDWRFARVGLEVMDGDVDTAIEVFSKVQSPDLVVVQTEEIDDSFAARLEELAGHCKEDTAAIVIGPVNDVYLYRKLIGMGVSDYLVKPIVPEVFMEVIAKTLIERIGASGSHLVAVLGAKGGVGTSSIAHMLAWGVSAHLKQKIMLMDASGGWSATSVSFGFEPITTLPEAMRVAESSDEDNLRRMLVTPNEKLSILATGGDVMLDHDPDPAEIENAITLMMTKYPVVLMDLSQAPAKVIKSIAVKAHKLILVTTPVLSSLRFARSLYMELKEMRGDTAASIDLVVNMQGASSSGEVAKADIEAALERKPEVILPYNAKTFIGCEVQGKKFFESKPAQDIIEKILPMVQPLVADAKEDSDHGAKQAKGAGILGFLSGKGKG